MVKWVIFAFLTVMNLGAFTAYGIDKKIAQRNGLHGGPGARRISEKALFLWALCGGSLGALLGIKLWRHKTRRWYFVWGVPSIMAAQLALAAWLIWKF